MKCLSKGPSFTNPPPLPAPGPENFRSRTCIQKLVVFKKIYDETAYLEPSKIFKMEFFPKIVKNYNYF